MTDNTNGLKQTEALTPPDNADETKKSKSRKNPLLFLLWFIEGILIGFGAILPGVSGGTLCVAFGMYRPIMETISDIRNGLKKHGLMLVVFALGVAVGFVGLSGLAAWLLDKNTTVVTLVFIGLIIGTFPELWRDAGSEGRARGSIVIMCIGFVVMLGLLWLLKSTNTFTIAPGIFGYLLCGVFWGFSFILPGLSSSTLLLFFGLYQPMLEGISHLDFAVIIPMAIGMLACVLPLSRVIQTAYKKQFNMISHCIMGIVAATTVMIFPPIEFTPYALFTGFLFVAGGAAASFLLSKLCDKIKKS